MRTLALGAVVFCACACFGPVVHAQQAPAPEVRPTNAEEPSVTPQRSQPTPPPASRNRDHTPPLGLLPSNEDALMDPRMARSWGELPARYFIATTFDVGFVYARPRVSLGYGRPFTRWFGIDMNPLISNAGWGAYTGLRLDLPFGDVRIGPRYFSAFNHTVLDVRETYDRQIGRAHV